MTILKRFIAAATAVVLVGCTQTCVFDVCNGDMYSYSYAPWQSARGKDAGARAEYYEWGARTQYPTGCWHRIEIVMYRGDAHSQTNEVKRARYFIEGTRESEAK